MGIFSQEKEGFLREKFTEVSIPLEGTLSQQVFKKSLIVLKIIIAVVCHKWVFVCIKITFDLYVLFEFWFDFVLLIMSCSWYLTRVFKNSDRKANFGPCPEWRNQNAEILSTFSKLNKSVNYEKKTLTNSFSKSPFFAWNSAHNYYSKLKQTSIIFLKLKWAWQFFIFLFFSISIIL